MHYLNFFWWLAKDIFKKEYPGFPPLRFLQPTSLTTMYMVIHNSRMRWRERGVLTIRKGACEESLATHDHLVPLALDHDLAPPNYYDYSPPPLDVQIMDEFYDDMQSWHEYLIGLPLHHDSLYLVLINHSLVRLLLRRLVCLTLMSHSHMCMITHLVSPLTQRSMCP